LRKAPENGIIKIEIEKNKLAQAKGNESETIHKKIITIYNAIT